MLETKWKYSILQYNSLIPTESGGLFYQFCKETSNNLEIKKECETSKISILISELLFNHDIIIHKQLIWIKVGVYQKTSDIPIIAHRGRIDKIFAFKLKI